MAQKWHIGVKRENLLLLPQKHQRTLGHRNTQTDFNSLHFHAKFGDDPLLDLTIREVKIIIGYLFDPNIHHQMYLH